MKKIVYLLLALTLLLVSCDKAPEKKDDGNKKEESTLTFPYDSLDLSEYITLSREDYVGVEYTKLAVDVTEAEIDAEFENYRMSLGKYVEVLDRGAEEGDRITLDYSGSIDGVVFEGGTAENQTITLGAGGFIDGFEDGIYGHKTGDVFVVDADFPENYGKEELNGKTAQFEMTIHKIEKVEYPEVTDAYLAENTEYKSVADLRVALQASLEEAKAEENKYTEQNEAYSKVYEKATFLSYPEANVETIKNSFVSYYESYAQMYQMEFEDFIVNMTGSTVEEFYDYAEQYAKSVVEVELIAYTIAKNEKITDAITEEEYKAYVSELALSQGVSAEEFEAQNQKETLLTELVWEKVMDFILENGKPITK